MGAGADDLPTQRPRASGTTPPGVGVGQMLVEHCRLSAIATLESSG